MNHSPTHRIDLIFKSLKIRMETDTVLLSRSDTDPAKMEAFDAYYRTANGKGVLNLLLHIMRTTGAFREPQTVVIQRTGFTSSSYNTLTTLGWRANANDDWRCRHGRECMLLSFRKYRGEHLVPDGMTELKVVEHPRVSVYIGSVLLVRQLVTMYAYT